MLGCQVVHLKTKRGSNVVAAYFPCKAARQTLLFSHGNAVDLGQMLPFYRYCAPTCSCMLVFGAPAPLCAFSQLHGHAAGACHVCCRTRQDMMLCCIWQHDEGQGSSPADWYQDAKSGNTAGVHHEANTLLHAGR